MINSVNSIVSRQQMKRILTVVSLLFLLCGTGDVAAESVGDIGARGCGTGCASRPINPTQLLVCLVTAKLGSGSYAAFKQCGDKTSSSLCDGPCMWFEPGNNAIKTKFNNGAGVCYPNKLVPNGGVLQDAFTDFVPDVRTNLPALSVILACLPMIETECNVPGNGCLWCGPVQKDVYGGNPPLIGVCATTSMHGDYCADFKATRDLTMCPREASNRVAEADGCAAGCAFAPKRPAQVPTCIATARLGSGVITAFARCGVKPENDCKAARIECSWVKSANGADLAKYGAGIGACFPKVLVRDVPTLLAKFTQYRNFFWINLPSHAAIIACLAKNSPGLCNAGGCTWCSSTEDNKYGGVTAVCLTHDMANSFCSQWKRIGELTMCPEKIMDDGCQAGCEKAPTNPAQLVACISTARLESGVTTAFTFCGGMGENACKLETQCSWVKPTDTDDLAKFGAGTGACFPKLLVPDVSALLAQFSEYKHTFVTPLPDHSTVIIVCLAKAQIGCTGPTCAWCGPAPNGNHGGTPPLMGVCLPISMKNEFCRMFTYSGARTTCTDLLSKSRDVCSKLSYYNPLTAVSFV